MEKLLIMIHQVPFNTWITILSISSLVMLFVYLLKFLNRVDDDETSDWLDIIRDFKSDKISLPKFIQLLGSSISSWVVIQLTIQERLSWDIFSLYLMYCAGTEGFSKYLSAKYGIISKGNQLPNQPLNVEILTRNKHDER